MNTGMSRMVEALNIEIEATMGGRVPDGWMPGTNPWRVTLRMDGQELAVPFFTGPAVTEDPTAAGVLDCLLSDAQAGEQTFEEYCSDFGYDPDSREAYATWEQCRDSAPKLREFLGDHFEALLYSER